MRRWRRLDDGGRPGHAELGMQKEFPNEPGHAVAFAVGDIHSIEFGDDTFFIRVTGGRRRDQGDPPVRRREADRRDRQPGAGAALVRSSQHVPGGQH
jgi:hypothetical protein